ncbi:MAG: TonB-dependent receptor, partial [Alphaproteobacteria bacterium]
MRAAVPIGTDNDFDIRDFTQELRLRSDFDGPLNFSAGGFYQDGQQRNHIRLRGNLALGLARSLGDAVHTIDIKAYSLFGQVRWDILPTLELAGGLRWTDEERIHKETNLAPTFGPVGPVSLLDPRLKSSNVSPEVTLTYTPNDDLTLFASYRQGFKSGSFNTLIYISPTTRASFNDEQVKGGEFGVKARAFDRAVTVNLAGYYYHYTNLQVGANELTGGNVIATRTINAASANVSGVDFDMTYAPPQVEGLRLRAAVNYNHARYDKFTNAPCGNGQTISQGCNQLLNAATGRFTSQDLSGRRLVRAPDWTGNIGLDYELPVGRDMKVLFGAAANYSSNYT